MKIKVKPWMQIVVIFLPLLLVVLGVLFGRTREIYRQPNPNIEITEAFPCNGEQSRQIQQTFPADINQIYICAFLQKGGDGTFTVEWHQFRAFTKFTYVRTSQNGWFYPVLEPVEELPIGIYTVEIKAGRRVQATTQFEIVAASE